MSRRVPVPPPQENDVQHARILRAILESDQFDDWVPDAAYFRDAVHDLDAAMQRLAECAREESIDTGGIQVVELPRRSGDSVRALVLPLDARVLLHSAIARMAPRVLPALPRDKVYGAGFHPNGERLFDGAGAEQARLFDLLRDAASESEFVEELEVIGLDEHSLDDLMNTMRDCGAEKDDAAFANAILAHADKRVPYVDDAVSFVANFELQPVDRAMLRERRNFFRSGRRYFVFDDDGRKSLLRLLAERGLEGRSIGRCDSKEALRLASDPSESLDDLFRLDPDSAPLDAFEVLPRLRAAHRTRLDSALDARTEEGGPGGEPLLRFRKQLGEARPWLRRALGTALRERSSWQACWTSMLLSDGGPLTEPETTLLLDVIADPELSDLAKTQARLTLARSSETSPERYWEEARPSRSTNHTRRAMFVASSFLAKRYPDIWEKTKSREEDDESRLAQLLMRKLQERHG